MHMTYQVVVVADGVDLHRVADVADGGHGGGARATSARVRGDLWVVVLGRGGGVHGRGEAHVVL